jgi:hypothetical protein
MERGGAMTPAGYRKFFDLVWEQAQKELSKELYREPSRDMPDFLKGLFK